MMSKNEAYASVFAQHESNSVAGIIEVQSCSAYGVVKK